MDGYGCKFYIRVTLKIQISFVSVWRMLSTRNINLYHKYMSLFRFFFVFDRILFLMLLYSNPGGFSNWCFHSLQMDVGSSNRELETIKRSELEQLPVVNLKLNFSGSLKYFTLDTYFIISMCIIEKGQYCDQTIFKRPMKTKTSFNSSIYSLFV